MNLSQFHAASIMVIVPLTASFLLPVLGIWRKRFCYPLTLIAIVVSFVSSIGSLKKVLESGHIRYYFGGWDPPWGIEFYIDHLSAFMLLLVTSISLLAVIYSKRVTEKELPGKEVPFYCMLLLLFSALLGMTATGDMFNLYVFL